MDILTIGEVLIDLTLSEALKVPPSMVIVAPVESPVNTAPSTDSNSPD